MTGPLSKETDASHHNLRPKEVLFLFAVTLFVLANVKGTKLYCAT